jgi:hypothetical protein
MKNLSLKHVFLEVPYIFALAALEDFTLLTT